MHFLFTDRMPENVLAAFNNFLKVGELCHNLIGPENVAIEDLLGEAAQSYFVLDTNTLEGILQNENQVHVADLLDMLSCFTNWSAYLTGCGSPNVTALIFPAKTPYNYFVFYANLQADKEYKNITQSINDAAVKMLDNSLRTSQYKAA